MKLPRSTFYASRKVTQKQSRDEDLVEKISQIQQEYFFTIGRRRMGALLRRRFGLDVCETALQRLMSRNNLCARIRQIRKVKPQAGRATTQELPGNALNRNFKADKPLQRLVTDVTYIPFIENDEWHWGYLSLVQDLYDRSIVSWVFAKKQDVKLSLSTLQLLSHRGLAEDAMLHSDRGSIYTAHAFREEVAKLGITQSFSRTGNCHDNATMECFNGTLKVEALYNPARRRERPTFLEQLKAIAEYIEFYNNKRPCSVLGNVAPAEFAKSQQAARAS